MNGSGIMRRIIVYQLIMILLFAGSLTLAQAQGKKNNPLFEQSNLVAWCIVPFDSRNRTPEERIEMLKRLKFTQYAYDWRHHHLDSFAEEIKRAKAGKVKIAAVWMWIDKSVDAPGKLSADNERLLDIMKASGLKAELWLGFNSNYFDAADDETRIKQGVAMIDYVHKRTRRLVTRIGLYNHGNWFGDPVNQIRILDAAKLPDVGIVYNFHHAHEQIDRFPELLKRMLPHLFAVNIDGLSKNGPQILPVGSGEHEAGMLRQLVESGYKGPIGILGHIETEDVEVVLRRNLEGLVNVAEKL